jgi:xanthine dehydrogenase accessory factor
MNTLRALLAAFDAAAVNGERCALATIVGVEGSSYRSPGARMLIGEGGTAAGGISPGCLEPDLIAHAHRVITSNAPVLLEYETASTDRDVAWGLGIGCGGTIRILVEPLAPESSYVAALRLAADERRNTHGLRLTTAYDDHSVTHDAQLLSRDEGSATETMPGVLVETLLPAVPLVVFGAGPDAAPLVALACNLGWSVEVVDPQARPGSQLLFPVAERVTLARPHDVGDHVTITPRTMTVIMSHDYSHDLALLGFLLGTPARYIGVVGPARRTQRMLDELAAANSAIALDDASLARLHAPAGLDIGADGPQEIALSIIAEMRADIAGREGGMLRLRAGGLRGQPESECVATASAR